MKNERAVLLPSPGDPLLLRYWLDYYDRFIAPEVGHLYVHLNTPAEVKVVNYIVDIVTSRPHTTIILKENQIEHGQAIKELLNVVREPYLMLIEDDAFVFRSGAIDSAFRMIENGDKKIVGGKRGSCSMQILEDAKLKWGLSYEGYGDQGCNFWPCYFFCPTELLLSTGGNYGARGWKVGETIEGLGTIAKDDLCGDTFVQASLELRNMVREDEIAYLPQYHCSPDDLDDYEHKRNIFDGVAPWCHVGSLSSGFGGVLKDNHNRPLARRAVDPEGGQTVIGGFCNTEQEKREWERRVQMWLTFWERREGVRIEELAEQYKLAIDRIISCYGLSLNEIRKRQEAYKIIGL